MRSQHCSSNGAYSLLPSSSLDTASHENRCRSLQPALVPQDAADGVRAHPASQPVTAALAKLPPAHRSCIVFLARFVRQYFLADGVVAQTKMGLDNLTLIFGPCFFGDSSDAMAGVMNLNAEQDVCRRLFDELPGNIGATLQRAMQTAGISVKAAQGDEKQAASASSPRRVAPSESRKMTSSANDSDARRSTKSMVERFNSLTRSAPPPTPPKN